MSSQLKFVEKAIVGTWWVIENESGVLTRPSTLRIAPDGTVELLLQHERHRGRWQLDSQDNARVLVEGASWNPEERTSNLRCIALDRLEWTAGGRTLSCMRAPTLENALMGDWQLKPAQMPAILRGDYRVSGLSLGFDGQFVLRLGGGVVRRGRWGVVRESRELAFASSHVGTLVLEPADAVLVREHWRFALRHARGDAPTLELYANEGAPLELQREPVPVHATWFEGRWRCVRKDGEAPEQLRFAMPNLVHVLNAVGQSALRGTWTGSCPRTPDLEQQLEIAVRLEQQGRADRTMLWTCVVAMTGVRTMRVQSKRQRWWGEFIQIRE